MATMQQVCDLVAIGGRIQQARKAAGLTQYALAQQLGCGQGWVADIERGRQRYLHAETVVRFCAALGLSADYLLGLDEADAKRYGGQHGESR